MDKYIKIYLNLLIRPFKMYKNEQIHLHFFTISKMCNFVKCKNLRIKNTNFNTSLKS